MCFQTRNIQFFSFFGEFLEWFCNITLFANKHLWFKVKKSLKSGIYCFKVSMFIFLYKYSCSIFWCYMFKTNIPVYYLPVSVLNTSCIEILLWILQFSVLTADELVKYGVNYNKTNTIIMLYVIRSLLLVISPMTFWIMWVYEITLAKLSGQNKNFFL